MTNDMISKTAALEAVKRETGFDDDHPAIAAIAALPAVTVGVRGRLLGYQLKTAPQAVLALVMRIKG